MLTLSIKKALFPTVLIASLLYPWGSQAANSSKSLCDLAILTGGTCVVLPSTNQNSEDWQSKFVNAVTTALIVAQTTVNKNNGIPPVTQPPEPGGGITITNPSPVAARYNLNVDISGQGSVVPQPGTPVFINCGADCSETDIEEGTLIGLVAKPASGYTFNGWGGSCQNSDSEITFAVNQHMNCTANFLEIGSTPNSNNNSGNNGIIIPSSETGSAGVYFLLSGEQFREYTSFVRITNITNQQITVSATLRDETGQVLGQANVPMLTLDAQATEGVSMVNLQSLLSSPNWNGAAWLEVSAPTDSIRMMNMLRSPNTTLTDLSLLENNLAYNLPSSTNQLDEMFLILANPTDDSMLDITATVYNKDGQVQGNEHGLLAAELAPKSMTIITSSMLEQMLETPPWTGRAWLKITSDHQELKLMDLLMSKSSATITNMSSAADNALNNLPGTTNGNGDTAFIRIINTTGNTLLVRGTLYHKDGYILGDEDSVLVAALPPYSTYGINMAELETKVNTAPWTGRARLVLTVPPSGVKLAAAIRSPSGTITNASAVATTHVLYNIPGSINGNNDIGFVRITNPGNHPVQVKATLYHMDGTALGSPDVVLIDSLQPAKTEGLSITQLETLFGTPPWTGRARLVITSPTSNIQLMMMVRTEGNTLTNLSGMVGN